MIGEEPPRVPSKGQAEMARKVYEVDPMSKIDYRRVILGGLAAGLTYNIINWLAHGVILKAASGEAMAELDMTPPGLGLRAQLWLIWFIYGMTLAWIHAAIRPRFGPRFGTAIRAAIAVWIVGIVVPALPNAVLGFAALKIVLVDCLVGFVGLAVAGVLAAYIYKE